MKKLYNELHEYFAACYRIYNVLVRHSTELKKASRFGIQKITRIRYLSNSKTEKIQHISKINRPTINYNVAIDM
jgi:hypothetical protein